MAVVCALLAGGCAGDDREGSLAISTEEDGASGSGELSAAPRWAVDTTAIDLGWVTTGHAASARIRVENLGPAPLPAPAIGFAPGSHDDFSLIQDGCAGEVAAGESCELKVQLVPSGTGERTATLELSSDVGGQARVALKGLGLALGGLGDFSECRINNPGECASNVCVEFFLDLDGDGYGKGQTDGIGLCGDTPPPVPVGRSVRLGGDCCDLQEDGARGVHPDATIPVPVPLSCQALGVPANDFNCRQFNAGG
jgi:hypothetical protein